MLETPPFTRMTLGEQPKLDTFTVKLNEEERRTFEELKKIIEQEKDSTAIKQLASIGAKVLLEPKMAEILAILFKNKRNNKRGGIVTFEV